MIKLEFPLPSFSVREETNYQCYLLGRQLQEQLLICVFRKTNPVYLPHWVERRLRGLEGLSGRLDRKGEADGYS